MSFNLFRTISLDGEQSQLGIVTTADNRRVIRESDLLILAVKPKDVEKILKEVRDSLLPHSHLLISVVAGIRTATIEKVCLS